MAASSYARLVTQILAGVATLLVAFLAGRVARAEAPSLVAAGSNADGRVEVFYGGTDGALHHKWQTMATSDCDEPSLENWADGATLSGAPVYDVTVGTNADGRLEVFFVGYGNQMYHAWQAYPGSAFSAPSTFFGTAKNIVVGTNLDGRLEVFFVGLDDYIYHAWQEAPSSSDWGVGALTGSPGYHVDSDSEIAVGRFLDGQLDVFFVDTAGYIEEVLENSSLTGWLAPHDLGPIGLHVAVRANYDGRLEVLYADTSSTLRFERQYANNEDSWTYGDLGVAARAIVPASNYDGRIEAFFLDTTGEYGNLQHVWQDSTDGPYDPAAPFGWQTRSVSAVRDAGGCVEVFYVRDDGSLYHQYQLTSGQWWSGEYPFPESNPTVPFTVGSFSKILSTYDGSPNWHVNDHALVEASDGWHMFGIVAPNPDFDGGPVVNWMGAALGPSGTLTATSLSYAELNSCAAPYPAGFPCENVSTGRVLWAPHIVSYGSTYSMFYADGSAVGDATGYQIALRTSADLVHWSDPPVELFADGYQARDPMVLAVPGGWVMYYTATDVDATGGGHHVVAYRTSTSLDDAGQWASSARGIAYDDYHVGNAYGPTESPFVVHHGPYYYLFVGPRPYDDPGTTPNWDEPGYVGTDVFRSSSPYEWSNADYVGSIPAHALEVVVDTSGHYYVTSAGIHQGGLYAATLTWSDGY